MPTPTVEANGLGRRFGRRWALAHVDLRVHPGERLLVVGGNGGGKTTLLRVLATLLSPSAGTLRLFGREPGREPGPVRRELALVGHQPALYEDLSARDNLRVLARLLGEPDATPEWLARVGLPDRPDPVRTFSAGMRKRLSFARLLAQRPRLALLDEPYGQLDPEGFDLVDRLLEELADQGAAVVIASHQVARAGRACDRALLLKDGLPLWTGPAGDAGRAWRAAYGEAA